MTHSPTDPGQTRQMRRKGVARRNQLLDATEALLAEDSDRDITLAQIAAAADVPLPSVYHFFPNRNAAFEALAQRFNQEIYELSIKPLRDPEPKTWQELLHLKHLRAAALQNDRPAALRLFLGAGVSAAVRNADFRGNARVARSNVRFFDAYFHMPQVPDFARHLEIAAAAADGIWALSYGRSGMITEEFRHEATMTAIAYLRQILPENLPRKPLTEAALAAILVPA